MAVQQRRQLPKEHTKRACAAAVVADVSAKVGPAPVGWEESEGENQTGLEDQGPFRVACFFLWAALATPEVVGVEGEQPARAGVNEEIFLRFSSVAEGAKSSFLGAPVHQPTNTGVGWMDAFSSSSCGCVCRGGAHHKAARGMRPALLSMSRETEHWLDAVAWGGGLLLASTSHPPHHHPSSSSYHLTRPPPHATQRVP